MDCYGHASGKQAGKIDNTRKNKEYEFLYVYMFFLSALGIAYQTYEGLGLSTFITLAAALQLLAYGLLALKVVHQQSVRGVSGKALQCHACVYLSRLSSTTWLKGYIPSDGTGDGLYQLVDILSLVMVLYLLFLIYKKHRATYQESEDDLAINYILAPCFMLAVLLHPTFNDRPLFDTMWTFALYVDVFAMMPQLWMVSKLGKEHGREGLDAMSAHYIFAIAASRGVNFAFWLYGYVEFAPSDGGYNVAGWAVIVACIIQILLLLDFVVIYIKACLRQCMNVMKQGGCMQMPPMEVNGTYDI